MKKVIYLVLLSFVLLSSIVYAQDKWTWMLYLLEDDTQLDGMDDLNEWEANGSTQNVNYVVLINAEDDSKDGVYYIQEDPNGYDDVFRSPRVSTQFGTDFDMSDWHTLRDFMNYCVQNYPADHYGLTLWDHGNGIFKGEITNGGIFGPIIRDNNATSPKSFVDGMKLWELDDALSAFKTNTGQNLDIIGFDVCLLGQIETAYQLKDYVDYVIASEKTEPGDGWDYVAGFSDMTNNDGNISAVQQATNIVNSYVSFYQSKNGEASGVTQAATSTALLESDLIPALNTFADKLRRDVYNYETKIKNARNNSSYWDGNDFIDHRDLGSFAKIIHDDTTLPSDLRNAAQDVLDALDTAVVAEGHTVTMPAYGLKIWMPTDIDNDAHESYYMTPSQYLTFSNTLWDEYLYNYNNPQPYDNDRPAVENLSAIVGDGFVTLNWDAPSSKNTLDHYRIERDGSLLVDNLHTTTYTDNSVTNGVTYNYDVYAVYTGTPSGDSSPSSISATPNAPLTLPYSQDFSSGTLPTGWENIDNQGNGQIWRFDNPGGRTFNSSTNGNGFAILDSDNYGNGNSQNADLISPIFDLSNYSSVTLQFEHYFKYYSGSSATLSYTNDGGANWNVIQTWSSDTQNAETFNQDFTTGIAGESNVRFKWNYTGSYGWYWCVDDISVTGIASGTPEFSLSPATLDFGNVEINTSSVLQFTISNTGTGGILTGNITTPTGYMVVETDKGKQPNGGKNTLSYSIANSQTFNLTFTPTEVQNYDGTVTITCNEDTPTNLSVSGNGVSAILSATPDETEGISQTMKTNETATENLKLNNTGLASLTYTASVQYSNKAKDVIFSEDFENGGSIPSGWTQEYVTGSTDWIYENGGHSGHPASAHNGSYNAQFYHGSSTANVTRLVTPKISFGNLTDNAQLTFWHTQEVWVSDQDELRVYYKLSSSDSWHILATYTESVANWTQRVINLSETSDEFYIAFEGTGKYGYGVCIDDVQITGDSTYDWLTINGLTSVSGIIGINNYENLTIGFDSSDLSMGNYTANIYITSNDPNSPTNIPVALTVEANSDNSSEGSNNNGDGSGAATVDLAQITIDSDSIDPDVSVDPQVDNQIIVDVTVTDSPQHSGVATENTLISYSVNIEGNIDSVPLDFDLSYEGLSTVPQSLLYWNSADNQWHQIDSPSWNSPVANHVSFTLTLPNNKNGDTEFILSNDNNPLPVQFASFTSAYHNGKAILQWITESEQNSNFWNVYRSISDNFGQSQKINPSPIDGANNSTEETKYTFVDNYNFEENTTYYYWVENISLSGESSTFGPFEMRIENTDHNQTPQITSYGLYQNYPNPFNPDTKIDFALKQNTTVTLVIYNIKGEKVKTILSNSPVEKDKIYSVSWNGTNDQGKMVTSGIYYYQLIYDNKHLTKKMLLLK